MSGWDENQGAGMGAGFEKMESMEEAAVNAGREMTASEVLKAADGAVEGPDEIVVIDGREINLTEGAKRLNEALEILKRELGNMVNIDLDKIKFRALDGQIVGESTESGEQIDAIMMMHPALRLAQVLAHELLHNRGKFKNEGFVGLIVEKMLGKGSRVEAYEEAEANFDEFLRHYSKDKSYNQSLEEVYKLYYHGEIDQIAENFVGDAKGDIFSERHEMLHSAFPEYSFKYDPEIQAARSVH